MRRNITSSSSNLGNYISKLHFIPLFYLVVVCFKMTLILIYHKKCCSELHKKMQHISFFSNGKYFFVYKQFYRLTIRLLLCLHLRKRVKIKCTSFVVSKGRIKHFTVESQAPLHMCSNKNRSSCFTCLANAACALQNINFDSARFVL